MFTYDCDEFEGHLVNPTFDVVGDEEQLGPEGCLSIPGLAWDCRRHLHVVAHGWNQHGEPVTVEGSELLARCIQHETDHLDGVLFVDRLDAETRKLAMAEIRAAEWFGRPSPWSRQSPHPLFGKAGAPMRLVFAGTPAPALPSLRGAARLAAPRGGRRRDPAGRAGRPRPQARPLAGRRAGRRGRHPGAHPGQAARAGVPRRAARSWRRTAARWSPTARWSRGRRSTCPAHGWVNLHFSLLPAWRGAAPVQAAVRHGDDITGATTFLLEEGLDTGPIFGVVTEAIARHRHRGRPARPARRVRARGCSSPPWTASPTAPWTPVPQPTDGVCHAPKVTVDDARVDWAAPPVAVDRLVRSVTPEPGAWTTFRGERLGLGPVAAAVHTGGRRAEARRAAAEKRRVLVGTGSGAVGAGRGAARRQARDGRGRLGPRRPHRGGRRSLS